MFKGRFRERATWRKRQEKQTERDAGETQMEPEKEKLDSWGEMLRVVYISQRTEREEKGWGALATARGQEQGAEGDIKGQGLESTETNAE